MTSVIRGREGQAWLEFLLSAGVLVLTVTGAGWILKAQWVRARCAVLVFERTHARAHERSAGLRGSVSIDFTEPDGLLKGSARCAPPLPPETATVEKLR